jgi:uncharacterized protein YkwD
MMSMNKLFTGAFTFLIFTSCATEKPVVLKSVLKNPLVEVVNFQEEFLKRINKTRAEGCNCGSTYMPPVEPIIWNNQLQLSALGHAQDMARNGYFSHVSKNGNKFKDRILAAGYTPKGFRNFDIGENIAWGQRSIKEVMKGWLESPLHCKNLMNPAFREVGIALEKTYWVQDFGGRVPFGRRNSN